jgi:hypothetical protein
MKVSILLFRGVLIALGALLCATATAGGNGNGGNGSGGAHGAGTAGMTYHSEPIASPWNRPIDADTDSSPPAKSDTAASPNRNQKKSSEVMQ